MSTMKPLIAVALFLLGIASGPLQAQTARPLVQGREYDLIEPAQPTANPGKIEVIEFFSYACPHCYHFEPVVSKWLQKLPADVEFKRLPLSAGPAWSPTAKLFFALEAMGIEPRHHSDIFNAIHGDRSLNPNDESAISAWVAKRGVDTAKFKIAYGFTGPRLEQMQKTFAAYGVTGVPAIVVDGKYRIRNESINSYDDLMALTSAIIEKARAERLKSKPAGTKARK
jgi:thiol:disulfide interchange protein DsbA